MLSSCLLGLKLKGLCVRRNSRFLQGGEVSRNVKEEIGRGGVVAVWNVGMGRRLCLGSFRWSTCDGWRQLIIPNV